MPDREQTIRERAHSYDLAAMVVELYELGYSDEMIVFRSNHTRRHQAALIDSVEFLREPTRRAVISVNLSLLGPQSQLPTYFQKALDDEADSSLAAFLNFFSHRLIRADTLGMFPERDPGLFADFARTKRQLLSLIGLRSPATMHWLFQGVYPELEVAVRRTILQRTMRSRGLVLGDWMLGDGSVAGGRFSVAQNALGVRLFCEDPQTASGIPWAKEAERRLHEELFPIVQSHALFLEVALVIRDQRTFMQLAPNQFLGFEPIYAGEGPQQSTDRVCRTVIVWSGEVPCALT